MKFRLEKRIVFKTNPQMRTQNPIYKGYILRKEYNLYFTPRIGYQIDGEKIEECNYNTTDNIWEFIVERHVFYKGSAGLFEDETEKLCDYFDRHEDWELIEL